ncbi:RING finger protein ETP1-like protein [Lachnellula suecica]|uniref:RING finger protein ETP1-like protein n=1 Tax=Lachnellula suecica TaxID=602035 RepID=A0A8T9C1U4_9HELO|nr:RING finger protein ETP1-like protein [Lachnellula suecica]
MPSYFHHLKFELYPYPSSKAQHKHEHKDVHPSKENSPERERDPEREIWLPPPGSDIFDTGAWPAHTPVVEESEGRHKQRETRRDTRGSKQESRGAVIDCGPARALNRSSGSDEAEILVPAGKEREFPPPATAVVRRDLETAEADWRFGRVRVEGLDMEGEGSMQRHAHQRGESSSQVAASGGINAGLAEGRVTKALFEGISGAKGGKNTEVGWGVVHLYRDGEETPELGMGVEDLYGEGDDEDCTTLCVPAVPSYLTASDFLGFVGEKARKSVSHFRMVMTGRTNRYLVLMKFRNGWDAMKWKAEWDGKVFNEVEPETCHVAFIKSITFQTPTSSRPSTSFPELSHDPFTPSSTSTSLKPFPPPTPNFVELPTCPVCLERMDDTTGLLTILCQHAFHCECLQKWRGSGCPVCRHTNQTNLALPFTSQNSNSFSYDSGHPPFGSGEASLCSVCNTTDDLWICLICGLVGCGRYKGGHAKEHWKDTAHNFALEIETQHVWDYAGDMWVHRLIRDKGDGKLVELPSTSRSRNDHHSGEDVDMVPAEKLERIGMEYTHLLTSQLESQRVYFEELVSKAVSKASAASTSAATATARADEALSKVASLTLENKALREDVITALEKDLAREKKKAERSAEVARSFGKSLMEEKKVSEGLMERIGHINKNMIELSSQLTTVKEENAELKEQNRDLLFSITAQNKLKGMEGLEEGELEGGTVSLPPEKEKKGRKGKGKK